MEVSVEIVPAAFFKKWLAEKGRMEPQRKFPRVVNGLNLDLWKETVGEFGIRTAEFEKVT